MTEEKSKPPAPGGKASSPAQPGMAETHVFGGAASTGSGDADFVVQENPPADSHPVLTAASGVSWIGRKLDKYEIKGELGRGGMGVVLRAHDPLIDREVAIKLLPAELATNDSALQRFLSEAKAAGKLNHAHVASIFEIGQDGSTYFLVMELLPGGSVADRLAKNGACGLLEATLITIDACKGLAAAHAAGLVHRDIKPANLLVTADGSVKVTDFGLAKASAATQQLTQTGMIVGTPNYMSPEQCNAQPVDARSDLYSLGATYYSLLTGHQPYEESQTVMQVMYGHCHGQIPDPRAISATIPAACSAIIARAMAKAPADRYQTANEMLADLQALAAALSGEIGSLPGQTQTRKAISTGVMPVRGSTSMRWGLIGAGVAVAALVILTLALWRPWEHSAPVGVPGGEPIKVGVLHSMSGTMASSESVVVDATLLAIDEINQSGGLLGHPVKPVVADGRSDWPTFAREAERLISQEKVCTIFGCWTSASRKTVKPIFEEHDHLLLYPVQYEGLETSPNIFYMGAAPNQQIIPAVHWAVESLGKKRFFLVGSDYVFPRAAHEIIKDQLKQIGGQVVGETYLRLGSQHVEPAVKAIREQKPDLILNTINGDTNIAFFRELREAGIKSADIPCLSFSIGEQGLRSLNPADIEGDYAAWTYFQAIATPENTEFVARFQAKFPQRSVTDPAEAAYVGVKLWAQAVKESESLDPKRIRRALLQQRYAAPGGEVRIEPDNQHCYKTPRVGQITADGQFKIVWTAPEAVRPDPYPSTRTAADWKAYLHDLYTGWGNQWAAP
jgi:urea transport system substrate-binding protein